MRFLDIGSAEWIDRSMLPEIRYCVVPPDGFVFPLPVGRLVCVWPTYGGLAKGDLEEDLDEEWERAWPRILDEAVKAVCDRLDSHLSTLEYRKMPTYWDEGQRNWFLAEQEFDEEFLEDRQQFGHEFYLHLVGPRSIRQGEFFPDSLPLSEWLGENFAFLITGAGEAVVWSHWPNPNVFLEEVQKATYRHQHDLVHSQKLFVSHQPGRPVNYAAEGV